MRIYVYQLSGRESGIKPATHTHTQKCLLILSKKTCIVVYFLYCALELGIQLWLIASDEKYGRVAYISSLVHQTLLKEWKEKKLAKLEKALAWKSLSLSTDSTILSDSPTQLKMPHALKIAINIIILNIKISI